MGEPLGDGPSMEMVTAVSHPRLRALVAGYTGYRMAGGEPGIHRGLPSRYVTFIVTVHGTVDLVRGSDATRPPRSFHTLAGGLHTSPELIRHDGHQHGVQLALTPLGTRMLLGVPAGELAGAVVGLDVLLGRAAGELADRIRAAGTWTDRFRELDEVFTGLADRARPQAERRAPELDWAWRRLTTTHGQVPVATLAEETGWSRRHLSERFRREFGLTPKVAGRVMRFEVAHRLLRAPQRPALAEVAARCGYYDQAHLHREWRKLAGCSPSRWLAEEFPSVHDSDSQLRAC